MIVTLFGSSAYPERLLKLVSSLDRSVSYEVVVCGPRKTYCDVKNLDGVPFKYIYSEFKPVQCSMIAATHAAGEFLLHIVDDIHFDSEDGLLNLVNEHSEISLRITDPIFISTRLRRVDYVFKDSDHFLRGDSALPIPVSLFCLRELFFDLKGFSSCFITCMADADLMWRGIKNLGARFYLSSTVVVETKNSGILSLFDVYGIRDIDKLLNIGEGKIKNTFFPIEKIHKYPFGPSGMWRFKSSTLKSFLKRFYLFRGKIARKSMALYRRFLRFWALI